MHRKAGVPLTRSSRSRTVDRNRELLLAAAADVIVELGWDQLTYSAVAETAGLTNRPLATRFPTKSDLAIGLWDSMSARSLLGHMLSLIDLMVNAGSGVADPRTLTTALSPFIRPRRDSVVAIELLAACAVDMILRDHVSASINATLGSHLLGPSRGDRTGAAQRSYVAITAVGLLMTSRQPQLMSVDVTPQIIALAEALQRPAPHRRLPSVNVDHMKSTVVVTDDPNLDLLLNATIDTVASTGYHAASTARIVAAAGLSEGLLYGRFNSKLDLFLDATERAHVRSFDINRDLQLDLARRYDAGVAEAVMLREFQRPEHARERVLAIERQRLSWHEPQMRASALRVERDLLRRMTTESPTGDPVEASAELLWSLSLGNGANLLPFLLPEIWRLPYDVVTTSLLSS